MFLGVLGASCLLAGASAASSVPVVTELRVGSTVPDEAWVEILPLGRDDAKAVVLLTDELEVPGKASGAPEEGSRPLALSLASGLIQACTGAPSRGVRCEVLFWQADRDEAGTASREPRRLRWEEGPSSRGEIRLGPLPVEGARISVAPADVPEGVRRPFVLPLILAEGALVREVTTDEDGVYRLPPLAPGRYRLEVWWPTGRIDRSNVFELKAGDEGPVSLPALAEGGGLPMIVEVRDVDGGVVPDATVLARSQRRSAAMSTWQVSSDAEGHAELAGLPVDRPVEIECRAAGYRLSTLRFDQAPPFVDCVLEGRARLRATVVGFAGDVPSGLRARLVADQEDAVELAVDEEGELAAADLDVGTWTLTLAAPGHEMRRIDLDLGRGAAVDLGLIVLGAGRRATLQVLDKETGEPITGVEIEAQRPAGVVLGSTDVDGLLRLDVTAGEDLVLEARAERHVAKPLEIPAERLRRREPIVYELEPAGWMAVVVYGEGQGEPCAGCVVRIRPGELELAADGAGLAISPPLLPGWYRVSRAGTEHRGTLVVEHPETEMRHVRVRKNEVVRVELSAEPRELQIDVLPAGKSPRRLEVRSAGRRDLVPVGREGSFWIRRPPQLGPEEGGWSKQRLTLRRFRADLGIEEEIHLADLFDPVDQGKLTLMLPSTRLRARLLRGGIPWEGAMVELWALGGGPLPGQEPDPVADAAARTATGADGILDLRSVRPGVYGLRVAGFDRRFIVLEAGRPLDLGVIDVPP